MKKVYNVKENVIPAKRSASGNLMRCPVKRGMTESGRSMVEMVPVLQVFSEELIVKM